MDCVQSIVSILTCLPAVNPQGKQCSDGLWMLGMEFNNENVLFIYLFMYLFMCYDNGSDLK